MAAQAERIRDDDTSAIRGAVPKERDQIIWEIQHPVVGSSGIASNRRAWAATHNAIVTAARAAIAIHRILVKENPLIGPGARRSQICGVIPLAVKRGLARKIKEYAGSRNSRSSTARKPTGSVDYVDSRAKGDRAVPRNRDGGVGS